MFADSVPCIKYGRGSSTGNLLIPHFQELLGVQTGWPPRGQKISFPQPTPSTKENDVETSDHSFCILKDGCPLLQPIAKDTGLHYLVRPGKDIA